MRATSGPSERDRRTIILLGTAPDGERRASADGPGRLFAVVDQLDERATVRSEPHHRAERSLAVEEPKDRRALGGETEPHPHLPVLVVEAHRRRAPLGDRGHLAEPALLHP